MVQTPELPLRIVGIANSDEATDSTIILGKTVVLAVAHDEPAGIIRSVRLEGDLNIGHVGFSEVEDVWCKVSCKVSTSGNP